MNNRPPAATHVRWLLPLLGLFVSMAGIRPDLSAAPTAPQEDRRVLILVTGVGGTETYSEKFREWSQTWLRAGQQAGFQVIQIDGSNATKPSRLQLQEQLQQVQEVQELWLVLIGHGTFDGQHAKFNLVGDDVSANELASWLQARQQLSVIVNCASASAPFIGELQASNRVIVTSTKSGDEMSFSHFGAYLADAIGSQDIDLDKDQRTSLLEAVIVASGKTVEYYESESRLATEHALIEDNGDGLGTPVEWFRGIRVDKVAQDGTAADGLKANQIFFALSQADQRLSAEQLLRRNQLEEQIEQLRSQRGQLTADQYYHQLESILVPLSRLYQQADRGTQAPSAAAPSAAPAGQADESDGG